MWYSWDEAGAVTQDALAILAPVFRSFSPSLSLLLSLFLSVSLSLSLSLSVSLSLSLSLSLSGSLSLFLSPGLGGELPPHHAQQHNNRLEQYQAMQ